jgi:CRISPR-associated protein Cas1
LAWAGEGGIRLYAHSAGGTFSVRRLLRQSRLYADESLRIAVVYRMYPKRFAGAPLPNKTMKQVRGLEGLRVHKAYREIANLFGINWQGRSYDPEDWFETTAANRALSAANACLNGVCHAAIVWAGYSAAIGFIPTGKMLSFIYDIADLYNAQITLPVASRPAASVTEELERTVRQKCRAAFYMLHLRGRTLPDIEEVLDARDDPGEIVAELEGRPVPLADGGTPGDHPGQSKPANPG